MTTEDLIEAARRDIADADRCAALHVTPAVHQLHRRLREVTDALDALSSPPADDVREALIDAMIDVEVSGGMVEFSKDERAEAAYLADAILADPGIEVRPRGTVTDAEHREAVHRAVRAGIESVRSGDADRDVVRAVADQVLALEARS